VADASGTSRPERHITPPGNRAGDLALATLRRGLNGTLNAFCGTWLYHQTLFGPMPDHIIHFPKELRPGRVDKADALFQGKYDFTGGQVRTDGLSPFLAHAPSESWTEELHGFSWLRHFSAAGGESARSHANALVRDWMDRHGQWHTIGWRPHVIGRRLISWVANGSLILASEDLIYRSTLLRNMARQARHLARTVNLAPAGEKRFTAAIGLAFSGLCFSEGQARLRKGLKLVCLELEHQILPDGGHISRNPTAQLSILLDLISLRDALVDRQLEVPGPILNAVDRMMPMLRFFRHGDGKLALFNGSTEGPDGTIDAALSYDDAKGKPFGFAPHSGYQRLAAGPTFVVADTGPPPPGRFSHSAHAGTLSFEMSVGRCRLVTNCGDARIFGEEWRVASRATAAHSTSVLADTSSARFTQGTLSRILLGPRLIEGPSHVNSRRNETDDGIWLEASHNGYENNFGVLHRRRLFLATSGEDLRGEDTMHRISREDVRPWHKRYWHKEEDSLGFTIRFHLHPDAKASLAHDGSNVLIMLPNGDGWQFRSKVEGGHSGITLEESVYLGTGENTRRSEQIVVSSTLLHEEASIKWAWHRLSSRNSAKTQQTQADLSELPDMDLLEPQEDITEKSDEVTDNKE
jgi:uncharacterized heparinase superfamily protein